MEEKEEGKKEEKKQGLGGRRCVLIARYGRLNCGKECILKSASMYVRVKMNVRGCLQEFMHESMYA